MRLWNRQEPRSVLGAVRKIVETVRKAEILVLETNGKT